METIDLEALATVSGGNALTSWLDGLYHGIVDKLAGHVGGNKVAQTMYGKHATAKDRARSQAAMTKFLADGHKLPKGVPNLFG
jgi:hypothetical protein